ncbi:MAG: two pore domain potassium channel family protein [Anaerolineae bacterium]|nr:two pore domain potassium channel family protein [Anaerolineae bacterium]
MSLTTAGYGDFLPVSWWACSIASAETVIGVLYLAILMARLVGLFSQKE